MGTEVHGKWAEGKPQCEQNKPKPTYTWMSLKFFLDYSGLLSHLGIDRLSGGSQLPTFPVLGLALS